MPYTQTFFIEGKLIGSVDRQAVYYHEQLTAPPSLMFLCRVCGDVYARAPVVAPSGKQSEFHSITRLCRKHKAHSMFEVPGSIWMSWDKDFLAALPMPVLKEELLRHIEAFEGIENEHIG